MILAGSDFDENHLQVLNTLIIKEVVPVYEKSKIKLRDDTAFLFLKGRQALEYFTDEENTSKTV